MVSFSQGSPPKLCKHLSSPYVLHVLPISFFSIRSPELYWVRRAKSLSPSLRSFLHSPVTSSLLDPNILLNTLYWDTLSLGSSLNVSDQHSHPYTTGKIIVLYILIFKVFHRHTTKPIIIIIIIIIIIFTQWVRPSVVLLLYVTNYEMRSRYSVHWHKFFTIFHDNASRWWTHTHTAWWIYMLRIDNTTDHRSQMTDCSKILQRHARMTYSAQ